MANKNQEAETTTGGLEFVEDCDAQVILGTTPKRKQKIKIFVPVGSFARWKITYDNGKPIDELPGYYLSRREAMKAVTLWERAAKKTIDAKQFEFFGDKEPPVLKRKRVRGARAEANTS